jgi:hypothetical protein
MRLFARPVGEKSFRRADAEIGVIRDSYRAPPRWLGQVALGPRLHRSPRRAPPLRVVGCLSGSASAAVPWFRYGPVNGRHLLCTGFG